MAKTFTVRVTNTKTGEIKESKQFADYDSATKEFSDKADYIQNQPDAYGSKVVINDGLPVSDGGGGDATSDSGGSENYNEIIKKKEMWSYEESNPYYSATQTANTGRSASEQSTWDIQKDLEILQQQQAAAQSEPTVQTQASKVQAVAKDNKMALAVGAALVGGYLMSKKSKR